MGKIISNGIEYGGSSIINEVNGMFIDTNNIIVPLTEYKSSMTYTATEDCYVILYTVFGSNTTIRINSEIVGNFDGSGNLGITNNFYLKNGQTISVANASSSYNSYYIIYGIQQGSKDTAKNEIYSTEERAVGIWIDGSTIYKKTIEIPKSSLVGNRENTIVHGISNFGQLVKKESIYNYSGGDMNTDVVNPTVSQWFMQVHDVGAVDFDVYIGSSAYDYINEIFVTFYYTKSTT